MKQLSASKRRLVDLSVPLENEVIADPPGTGPENRVFSPRRHRQDNLPSISRLGAQDVEAELKRIGHTLSPLEIVLVNTAAGARYGQPDYVSSGCGMGREATLYLTSRGIKVAGTDGWSWDAPFVHTAKRYAQTGNSALIWEGHKAGREIGYAHIEKLHNLEPLPDSGFLVSCFPVKIRAASAGWSRVVAIFEDPL
jgi:kynurenine formamidase